MHLKFLTTHFPTHVQGRLLNHSPELSLYPEEIYFHPAVWEALTEGTLPAPVLEVILIKHFMADSPQIAPMGGACLTCASVLGKLLLRYCTYFYSLITHPLISCTSLITARKTNVLGCIEMWSTTLFLEIHFSAGFYLHPKSNIPVRTGQVGTVFHEARNRVGDH